MKKWSWLLAMVLGVGMVVCVGCEDDDDNGGGTTTTIVTNIVNGTTVVVTNTTPSTTGGGTTGGGTTGGGTSGGGTPTPTEQDVINRWVDLQPGGVFTAAEPIPGTGSVTYDVQWVALDELDNSRIEVSLIINCGMWGEFVFDSPFVNTVSQGAGSDATVYLRNPNPGAQVEAHVIAHWSPP